MTDQYARGDIKPEERDSFEQYFFKSPDRQAKLRFAVALKQRRSELIFDRLRKKKLLTFYLPIAACLIVALGLGIGIWRVYFAESNVDRGLVALHNAYREERPTEARLSDFKYAPVANQRGGPVRVDYLQRDLATSLLLKEAGEHPGAKAHHAAGQYYLAERKFDQAIDQLKKALALDPNNAKIHSDLGAALLEEGKTLLSGSGQGEAIRVFDASLTNLNKSLDLQTNLEALFNRALVYDYLALPVKAAEDWQRYLQLDPNSKWAEEARQHLKRIEEKRKETSQTKEQIFENFQQHYELRQDDAAWNVLRSYHNRAGNVVIERLLDDYLGAERDRNGEARRRLQMLSYAGQLAMQKTGDRFFSDLAAFYQQINDKQRETLLEARALVKKGHDGWGHIKVEENLLLFSHAKNLFELAGDVGESRSAKYWQSFCYYRQHNDQESLSILEPLISTLERAGYKSLLARSLYLLAAVQFNRNEHSRAVESAKLSLALTEKIEDKVGIINALSSLTEYFRYLGYYDRSLSYIQRSFPLVSSLSMDPIQASRHYGFEATAFASAGLLVSAAVFQTEALRFAMATKNASVISYHYAFLGTINGKLRNFEEGLQNTRKAYEIAHGHSNDASDRELMAYAMLQMGHIQRQAGSFDDAVQSYTRSIEGYQDLNHPTNLYQAHKGRFFSYLSLKKDDRAREELRTTVKLAEQYRDQILEETTRQTFFAAEQNFFDVAIDFQYSRIKDPQGAFQLSESSRARSLLDLIHADAEVLTKSTEPEVIPQSVSEPLSTDEILRRVPEQSQVVQYSVLENRLLIWVISSGKLVATTKEIGQKQLSDKVLAYLKLASLYSANNDELITQGRDLFDILIKPVESTLDSNKQICLIPDKALNYLPFAALMSSTSGRYLIEDYRLSYSPSSTIFIINSDIARQKSRTQTERMVSVGNPRFDHTVFPAFQDLPAADREADQVAACYTSPVTLLRDDAKVGVVKSAIEKADIVHFAVHAEVDERFPLRSKLLLAKDSQAQAENRSGALNAHEIYSMRLNRTRLVVLSACQTAAERYYSGEGMISMARPFIAARVPMVVATLWPVDSNAAAELMIGFHRNRKCEGTTTAEGLRMAQLSMLRSGTQFQHPYYWAPFVLIGGYSEF